MYPISLIEEHKFTVRIILAKPQREMSERMKKGSERKLLTDCVSEAKLKMRNVHYMPVKVKGSHLLAAAVKMSTSPTLRVKREGMKREKKCCCCVCVCVRMRVFAHAHMCMCVCVLCAHLCVCVHTHTDINVTILSSSSDKGRNVNGAAL